MEMKTILVPIEVSACALEVFPFINQLAAETAASITLLHVSNLNIVAPENRLYTEVARDLEMVLSELQSTFVSPWVNTRICVRSGRPTEEIVAAAVEAKADLIVMSYRRQRRWQRLFHTRIIERVIAAAPCPVKILRVATRIDCSRKLKQIDRIVAHLGEEQCAAVSEPV